MSDKVTGLALLRKPFSEDQISQLPKPTCKKAEYDKLPKGKCKVCGGYHATSKTIHLSYVGHAALTNRLIEADEEWNWRPLAMDEQGLPLFDKSGGLWIELTVCGHTMLGYGHAKQNDYAEIGSREKEVIGDALRNAAMRMGAALDLWHKGDLSFFSENEPEIRTLDEFIVEAEKQSTSDMLVSWYDKNKQEINMLNESDLAKLLSFLKQLKNMLIELEQPQLSCPVTKSQVSKAACDGKDCRLNCKIYKGEK